MCCLRKSEIVMSVLPYQLQHTLKNDDSYFNYKMKKEDLTSLHFLLDKQAFFLH